MNGKACQRRAISIVLLITLVHPVAAGDEGDASLQFTKRCLVVQPHEGCAIADLNRDGKPDIVTGPYWFSGPEFVRQPIRAPRGSTG